MNVTMDSVTRHLMLDAIWRSRMAWFFAGFCLLPAWALVAVGVADTKVGMAASLIAVFAVGPVTSLSSLMVRETRFLPLTSRNVWVAAWLLSSVAAPVVVVVVQLAGFSIGLAFGYPQPNVASSVAFVAACTFAYGGVMLPIGPLMGYTSHAATERRPQWLWGSVATLTFLAYLGGLIGPWAAWSYLPTSFETLGVPAAVVLGLGLVAAVGAFFWTPQRYGGMGRPTGTAPVSVAQASGRVRSERVADRFTGLSRLLVPTLVWAFGLTVTGAAGMAWYFVTFEPSLSLYESFAGSGLLIFSAAGFSPKVIMGTALFAPFFAIGSGPAWDGYTRHLRVLPLSASDTTRLFITSTMLLWAVVWVVLLGIHGLVLGLRPDTLRPELFVYLLGLSALMEAVSRSGKKPGRPFSLAVIPVFVLIGVAEGFTGKLGVEAMFWSHAAIGASSLLIAAALTYRSITRSTSAAGVYQSAMPSFSVRASS